MELVELCGWWSNNAGGRCYQRPVLRLRPREVARPHRGCESLEHAALLSGVRGVADHCLEHMRLGVHILRAHYTYRDESAVGEHANSVVVDVVPGGGLTSRRI
jgi:hypothetical protein